MAVVTASSVAVFNHIAPFGFRANGSGNAIMGCHVSGMFTGTYDQASNAIFSCVGGVSGAIASSRRDGKTVTLLDAAFAAPGDEAGTKIGGKTVAISTADITLELTGSDMSTEHSAAVLGTMSEPVCLYVTYVLS